MTPLLSIVTTICIGLLIGTELTVSVFINPVLVQLEDRARAKAVSLFATRLGHAMPFWYGVSLLLLIIETITRYRAPYSTLLIVACAIWLAVIALSVLVLVPINNRMMQLNSESFSQEAQREHQRWTTIHHLRVIALVVAMACYLLATHG